MKRLIFFSFLALISCHYTRSSDAQLSLIQILDRNGLSETISDMERLERYEAQNFLDTQPYKKVLRVYRKKEKNRSVITTYHPNGQIHQYLEAEQMRAKGAYREWFPNGQQRIEAFLVGGTADLYEGGGGDWIFDRECRVWDEDGNPIANIPYQNGLLEGKSLYFFPDGEIERELIFKKNELNGPALTFRKSGELKEKTHYTNGMKEGKSISYFPDGNVEKKELYSEGRLLEGTYFDPEGKVISEVVKGAGYRALYGEEYLKMIEYRVGIPEGTIREFSLSGKLRKVFSCKGGMKEGEEIDYFPQGENASLNPKLSIEWKENAIHGSVKTWYENAQLQSQREFVKNMRHGPSLAWYKEGSLMLFEEYESDQLIQGQYYKKGCNDPVSCVIKGSGIATLFDEEGVFLQRVTYQNGKVVVDEE